MNPTLKSLVITLSWLCVRAGPTLADISFSPLVRLKVKEDPAACQNVPACQAAHCVGRSCGLC